MKTKSLAEVLDQRVESHAELELTTVRRAAFIPEVRAIDEKSRTITFTASTEAVDRYGDVIRVAGWKLDEYKKNPVFLWAHRSGDPPIGRTVAIGIETNPTRALVQKVEFADKDTYPFADTVFNLYKGGFMKSVSVGFRPLAQPSLLRDDEGRMTGYEFTSQELLELSAVPIPANPEAVARALDSGVTEADVKRVFITDAAEQVALVLRKRAELIDALCEVRQLLMTEPYKSIVAERLKLKADPPQPEKRSTITTVEGFELALRGAN